MKEKLFIHVPISVYIGWITVATIANVTAVLVRNNWDGFGISEEIWTILVIIVATIITLLVLIKRKDWQYGAVIVWAFIGIYLKRISDEKQIAYIAAISIFVILAMAIISAYKEHKEK